MACSAWASPTSINVS